MCTDERPMHRPGLLSSGLYRRLRPARLAPDLGSAAGRGLCRRRAARGLVPRRGTLPPVGNRTLPRRLWCGIYHSPCEVPPRRAARHGETSRRGAGRRGAGRRATDGRVYPRCPGRGRYSRQSCRASAWRTVWPGTAGCPVNGPRGAPLQVASCLPSAGRTRGGSRRRRVRVVCRDPRRDGGYGPQDGYLAARPGSGTNRPTRQRARRGQPPPAPPWNSGRRAG